MSRLFNNIKLILNIIIIIIIAISYILCFIKPSTLLVNALPRSKIHKCDDTPFCKTYRNRVSKSKAVIVEGSITIHHPTELSKPQTNGDRHKGEENVDVAIIADVQSESKVTQATSRILRDNVLIGTKGRYVSMRLTMDTRDDIPLMARLYCLKNGAIRFIVDQDSDYNAKKRYNEFWKDVLIDGGDFKNDQIEFIGMDGENSQHLFLCHKENTIAFRSDPFRLNIMRNGRVIQSLNENNMIYFEQKIKNKEGIKDDSSENPRTDETTAINVETSGEKDSVYTDTRPNGPMSVGFDLLFPYAKHLYGLPEHTSPLSLKNTDGSSPNAYSEPYRLYNLDVYEYPLDSPGPMYGSIPILISASTFSSNTEEAVISGVYYNNPSELYVDIAKKNDGKNTRWMSESGLIDLFFLPGPKIEDVMSQYTSLTGTQQLPPIFAIAYHQSRWNYNDEKDVLQIDENFDKYNVPVDVIWLDIEHTDGKRYFTWDKDKFPDPIRMQNKLWENKRRLVTIVDPHVKRDNNYRIHKIASEKGYYVKDRDGKSDFQGVCWPGISSYLDFTSEEVRSWWADQFAFDLYVGSTPHLFIWNDMNEPSVFLGPETSMKKDAVSINGIEHREWHNLYGFYNQMGSYEGLIRRHGVESLPLTTYPRPFVLSRSFFAGSPRHGAVWTGDNRAKWEFLKITIPMLLSLGLGGQAFVGADVGGFLGDPSTELLQRWYQAGAYQPFFRAHAHIQSKRREPWLFGPEVLANIRNSIFARYSYLPLIYTLFYEAHITGMPVMRPTWMHYPSDQNAFAIDNQWLLGKDLLVHPVTTSGAITTDVFFPGNSDGELWYDVITHEEISSFQGLKTGKTINVASPLEKIPVYQRGGSIVAKKMKVRRSTEEMRGDPYTLVVAINLKRVSHGTLYVDDELTSDFRENKYVITTFDFAEERLTSTSRRGSAQFNVVNEIEKIIILGWKNAGSNSLGEIPNKFLATQGDSSWTVDAVYDEAKDVMILKKPNLLVSEDFTLVVKGKR